MSKRSTVLRQLDKISVTYRVKNNSGQDFSTTYEMDAGWFAPFKDTTVLAVFIKSFTPVGFAGSGPLSLRYTDTNGDLAFITVSEPGPKYLTLGEVGALSVNSEVYSFAFDVSQLEPFQFEVRYGLLQIKCGRIRAESGRIYMVSKVSLKPKAGKSGSPLVDSKGLVVGMFQSQEPDQNVSYIVPAEYIQQFYNYVTQPGSPEPVLNCAACGLKQTKMKHD